MTLVSYRPRVKRRRPTFVNPLFDQFFNDLVKVNGKSTHKAGLRAPVNVVTSNDNYRLELSLPGWTKADINLKVEEDTLKISGEKNRTLAEGEKFLRRELNFGKFERSFQLPEDVDQEQISAEFQNGVLKVVLAKKEEAKTPAPRTIDIQ